MLLTGIDSLDDANVILEGAMNEDRVQPGHRAGQMRFRRGSRSSWRVGLVLGRSASCRILSNREAPDSRRETRFRIRWLAAGFSRNQQAGACPGRARASDDRSRLERRFRGRADRPRSPSGSEPGPRPWSSSAPSSWGPPSRKETFSSNLIARSSTRPSRIPKSKTRLSTWPRSMPKKKCPSSRRPYPSSWPPPFGPKRRPI